MKRLFFLLTSMVLMLAVVAATAERQPDPEITKANKADTLKQEETAGKKQQLVVYYLHGDRRCATCMKLESYTFEAIHDNFKTALEDSAIVWRVVNYETEGNERFVEDYKLFTKSVILSRVVDGEEVEWKNLDKIWQLVGDKERFLTYIAEETENFIAEPRK